MDGQENSQPQQKVDFTAPGTSKGEYKKYDPDKERNWRKPLKYIIILLVLAALGAGAYLFFTKDKPESGGNKKQTATPASTDVSSNVISTTTKHYASPNFTLEFDHPDDWKVTDAAGSGRLTVISPVLKLTDQDGKKVDGLITMTIRNKQQALPEFDKGNAIAARQSEKVAYTKPSEVQRGSTYLSLARYASSSGSGGDFDGVYITGDTGYQKDQAVPKADFTPVEPIISVTYAKCSDNECSSPVQMTVTDSMWDDPDYSKPIKAILQSLTIR